MSLSDAGAMYVGTMAARTEPASSTRTSPYASFADFHARSELGALPQIHRTGGSASIKLIKTERSANALLFPSVPELVVGLVLRGDFPFRYDLGLGWSAQHRLQKDDIRVCLPNTEAHYDCGDDYTLLLTCLPAQLVNDLLGGETGARCSVFEALHVKSSFRDDIVKALALQIWAESVESCPVSNLMIDGLAQSLVARLLRGARDGFARRPSVASELGESLGTPSTHAVEAASLRDPRLARAIDYVEANLGESLTVREIAAAAGLSAGHFARSFKATTGVTVWAHVRRHRVERAKKLLLSTRLPIAEIAFDCGFAHQGHLTHCFKRQFGVTPGALRQGR